MQLWDLLQYNCAKVNTKSESEKRRFEVSVPSDARQSATSPLIEQVDRTLNNGSALQTILGMFLQNSSESAKALKGIKDPTEVNKLLDWLRRNPDKTKKLTELLNDPVVSFPATMALSSPNLQEKIRTWFTENPGVAEKVRRWISENPAVRTNWMGQYLLGRIGQI